MKIIYEKQFKIKKKYIYVKLIHYILLCIITFKLIQL